MNAQLKSAWVSVLMLAAAFPLRADAVLLDETFDGIVGKSVGGWNGWTGDAGVVISKTVIDRGNSAGWAGDDHVPFPAVKKTFSYSPRNGDTYVLTATLCALDANGSYAEIRLAGAGGTKAKHAGVAIGYRDLIFEQNAPTEGPVIQTPQTAETMDVRMVVSDDAVVCHYRNHGESAWTLGGTLKAHNPIGAYNTVIVIGGTVPGRSRGGGIDNLRLTVEPQPRDRAQPK